MAEIFLPEIYSSDEDDDSIPKFVDVFPSILFTYDGFNLFKEALSYALFDDVFKKRHVDVVPFIPFKMCEPNGTYCDKLYYLNLLEDKQVLQDNLDRLYKSSLVLNERTGFEDVNWNAVHTRLSKDPRMSHKSTNKTVVNKTDGERRRGNADTRLAFCWRNSFIVRQNFTFGEMSTSNDEIHLLIIYNVPLVVYVSNHERVKEGTFNANRKHSCTPYILKSIENRRFTTFVVRENKSYLMLTLQKTRFAVFRLKSELFHEIIKSGTIEVYDVEEQFQRFFPLSEDELETKFGVKRRKRTSDIMPLDSLLWNPLIKAMKTTPKSTPSSSTSIVPSMSQLSSVTSRKQLSTVNNFSFAAHKFGPMDLSLNNFGKIPSYEHESKAILYQQQWKQQEDASSANKDEESKMNNAMSCFDYVAVEYQEPQCSFW